MKLTRLEATRVHGYLKLDIAFFPDLTFITGLNGSGKTTALRLLMGLLTPNLEELAAIAYDTATATVTDQGKTHRSNRYSNF
jgi:ABC-type transport system involved in cytochrome c biogenesis ATPase subunit